MAEWTWEDERKLAEAQHRLMPQNPAGPDMSQDQYILNADIMRNQLMAMNVRKNRLMKKQASAEVDLIQAADDKIGEVVERVEEITRENDALRAENVRLKAALEAKPKKK